TSLVFALVAGAVAGWLTRPPASPPVTLLEQSAPVEAGSEQVSFQKQREQWLLAAVKEYSGRNSGLRQQRVRHCLDLAQLYFEQGRLDDADKFFSGLTEAQRGRDYNALGRLGHAIVLAFRDQALESTAIFLELFGDREGQPGRIHFLINRSPLFMQW